jgi:hypothetical protein
MGTEQSPQHVQRGIVPQEEDDDTGAVEPSFAEQKSAQYEHRRFVRLKSGTQHSHKLKRMSAIENSEEHGNTRAAISMERCRHMPTTLTP